MVEGWGSVSGFCVYSGNALILGSWSSDVKDFVIARLFCRWLTAVVNPAIINVVAYVLDCVTHYAAESLSWYSRERLKQAWTPLSFQSRLMTPASSAVMKPSSAEPASTNSCRASSWERSRGGVNIINQPSQSLHHHCDSHELSS